VQLGGGRAGPGWWNPGALAAWLGEQLAVRGPCIAVSNACAAGLVALIQGARLLQRQEVDVVLVLGIDVLADFIVSGFVAFRAVSDRPCRPFDADRDGLSLGEGAAALLLSRGEPPSPAIGVIEGWAVTNDAHDITAPDPTGRGLARAIDAALTRSSLEPNEVDFINAHGTATLQNDTMEAEALAAVFGPRTPPVASMKGYFGHTLGAAGVIEAALCLNTLSDQVLPASCGFRTLGVDRPIDIVTQPRECKTAQHVLSLKSGFGGVNAAVVLGRAAGDWP
jgi:3-oxoacyl-[acyl-carrier-protein] synthase-1